MKNKLIYLIPMLLMSGCATQKFPAVHRAAPPPEAALAAIVGGYSVSPTTASVGTPGGTGSVSLTVPTWTASSSDPTWLTVTPISGSGNTTLTWSAAPNTGPARTATLTIADKSFIVSQAGAVTPPSTNWVRTFGGTSGTVVGRSVAQNANGDIFVVGGFYGSVKFGNDTLTSAGASDVFIAKFTSSGVPIWAKRYGGTSDEVANTFAIDSAGNLLVGGNLSPLAFVPGTTATVGGATFTVPGWGSDIFLAKYSPTGDHLWSIQIGGTSTDFLTKLDVDSQDNVVAAGVFTGNINFAGTSLASSFGTTDTWLAKFSPSGTLTWVKGFKNHGSSEYPGGVAVDKRNNDIVLAGYALADIDLGSGIFFPVGGYVARFTSAGALVWSVSRGTNNAAQVNGMTLDSNGDVLICGIFHGQTDLGAGVITGVAQTIDDLFVAKYSGSSGAYQWAKDIRGDLNISVGPNSIATDSQNNVLLVGAFRGTYNIGGQSLTTTGPDRSIYDGFIARYSSNGNPIFAQKFGGNGNDYGGAVSGAALATGMFTGSATFAGQTLTAIGQNDLLLARFAISSTDTAALKTNVLYVATTGNNATARRGDSKFPWADAKSAMSNAVRGDIVQYGKGTWTVTDQITVRDGVDVRGSGTNDTILRNGIYDDFPLWVQSDNTISDLWITNMVPSTDQAWIGNHDTGITNLVVSNFLGSGDADGFWFDSPGSCFASIENSNCNAKADILVVNSGAKSVITIHNSTFRAVGPSELWEGFLSRAIDVSGLHSNIVNAVNSTFIGSSNSVYVEAGSWGTVNLTNCILGGGPVAVKDGTGKVNIF